MVFKTSSPSIKLNSFFNLIFLESPLSCELIGVISILLIFLLSRTSFIIFNSKLSSSSKFSISVLLLSKISLNLSIFTFLYFSSFSSISSSFFIFFFFFFFFSSSSFFFCFSIALFLDFINSNDFFFSSIFLFIKSSIKCKLILFTNFLLVSYFLNSSSSFSSIILSSDFNFSYFFISSSLKKIFLIDS